MSPARIVNMSARRVGLLSSGLLSLMLLPGLATAAGRGGAPVAPARSVKMAPSAEQALKRFNSVDGRFSRAGDGVLVAPRRYVDTVEVKSSLASLQQTAMMRWQKKPRSERSSEELKRVLNPLIEPEKNLSFVQGGLQLATKRGALVGTAKGLVVSGAVVAASILTGVAGVPASALLWAGGLNGAVIDGRKARQRQRDQIEDGQRLPRIQHLHAQAIVRAIKADLPVNDSLRNYARKILVSEHNQARRSSFYAMENAFTNNINRYYRLLEVPASSATSPFSPRDLAIMAQLRATRLKEVVSHRKMAAKATADLAILDR